MPHYDYLCKSCGHREEFLQKITDPRLSECPQCHEQTFIRQFGVGIGLQFQGSGFYCTDYCGNQPEAPPKKESSSCSSSGCGCVNHQNS